MAVCPWGWRSCASRVCSFGTSPTNRLSQDQRHGSRKSGSLCSGNLPGRSALELRPQDFRVWSSGRAIPLALGILLRRRGWGGAKTLRVRMQQGFWKSWEIPSLSQHCWAPKFCGSGAVHTVEMSQRQRSWKSSVAAQCNWPSWMCQEWIWPIKPARINVQNNHALDVNRLGLKLSLVQSSSFCFSK